ncbi:MAG TPA: hypothetical protein VNJ12_11235, partial [Candidatus Dormibacteraeota bacterium]|nr:hypothetical protein [Candidatus Dormibacteraeota bacterium]
MRAETQRWDKSRFHPIMMREIGRPRARLGNPNTGIPEVVVQPIYDIYAVAPAGTMGKLILFSIPQNQAYAFNGVTSFLKGQGHTNLVQAGMLESSFTFIVRALSFYCQGLQGNAHPLLNLEDLVNLSSSYVNFAINRKPYFEGILAWLPGGGGPSGTGVAEGATAAASASYSATNGWSDVDNVYALPGGQYINPQETFS